MKGKILTYSNEKGLIRGSDDNLYYFHVTSIKQVLNKESFFPKLGLDVTFTPKESFSRGYCATNIKLPSISKKRIKTEKKHSFRSEAILNKILDIYMDSLNISEACNGWGEYFVDYYFNPQGKYIKFDKVSIRFVKSMNLKKSYKKRFDESCDYKVKPKTKKQIRKALKSEIIDRMKNYPRQYGRLEEEFLDTFTKSIKFEFKLKDEDGIYIKNIWSHALSEKEAEKRVFLNVPSQTEIINYKRVS